MPSTRHHGQTAMTTSTNVKADESAAQNPKLGLSWCSTVLGSPRSPWILAVISVAMMLPALSAGLFMDDLVQRVVHFKSEEIPSELQASGFTGPENGTFLGVMNNLFGFRRDPEAAARARDYGLLTWWMHPNVKAALWRPFTALTHWLDYQLFPNRPVLMHAHNIAWFAAVVFLVALIYRELSVIGAGAPPHITLPSWVAGFAAVLFLLDKNTYFPVLFVANRGFIVALCFGLLSLREHHLWRVTRSRIHLAAAMAAFALSLLANEGGVSTLAFLLAYAMVFETATFSGRVWSLIPALFVLVVWRIAYISLGFGVANLGGYIDPAIEPWLFLRELPLRFAALLGGQLSGFPPEAVLVFNPKWRIGFHIAFFLFASACVLAFVPILKAQAAARFWLLASLLAVIPAATVLPLSKNLAFVAVGASGVLSVFLVAVFSSRASLWPRRAARAAISCLAVWLVLAHLLAPLLSRLTLALVSPEIPEHTRRWSEFARFDIGGREVIIINTPFQIATLATPFTRAYYNQSLPASLCTLLPGNGAFRLTRTSEFSLQAEPLGAARDLLECQDLGPVHLCYLFQCVNEILSQKITWQPGDQVVQKGFVTEILQVTDHGGPLTIAFHFETSLNSAPWFWLHFNWATLKYEPFDIPEVGAYVDVSGPRPLFP